MDDHIRQLLLDAVHVLGRINPAMSPATVDLRKFTDEAHDLLRRMNVALYHRAEPEKGLAEPQPNLNAAFAAVHRPKTPLYVEDLLRLIEAPGAVSQAAPAATNGAEQRTPWLDVVAFRPLADGLRKLLQVGRQLGGSR